MATVKPGGEYISADGKQVLNAKGEKVGTVKDGKVVRDDEQKQEAEKPADPWAAFPGRGALEKAGLTSIALVAAKDDKDLLAVSGIGPTLLAEIVAHPEVKKIRDAAAKS